MENVAEDSSAGASLGKISVVELFLAQAVKHCRTGSLEGTWGEAEDPPQKKKHSPLVAVPLTPPSLLPIPTLSSPKSDLEFKVLNNWAYIFPGLPPPSLSARGKN